MSGASAVNEGVRAAVAPDCYLCGTAGVVLYDGMRDRLFDAPGTWRLKRCPQCELIWLDPRPIADDVHKLYGSYYTHAPDVDAPRTMGRWSFIKSSVMAGGFGYRELCATGGGRLAGRLLYAVGPLRDIVGGRVLWLHASRRGRLLDVGAGNGAFLARMRDLGWDVEGVEPDVGGVRAAREQFGLDVHHGTLDAIPGQDSSFDVITMHHVIEHVPDPIAVLRRCRALLRPGGQLIVVTPNCRSWGRTVYRRAWLSWDPPRHLFVLSPNTLQTIVERAGLRVHAVRTSARDARSVSGRSRIIRRQGNPFANASLSWASRVRGLAFQALEHGLGMWGDIGEEVIMIATTSEARVN